VRHQHCLEDDDVQPQHHMWNPHCRGRDDHEGFSLNPEEPGPKALKSTLHDAHFPKRFRALSNIIKFDGKANTSVWLEDYRLAFNVGRVDNDLFIIQFLPIYLADSARAWLEHLLRNIIDSLEDL
jgi:hypothetical protein